MITQVQKFIDGAWGKGVLLALMLGLVYATTACTAYHQVPMSREAFMAHPQIRASLPHYHIYVHDGPAIYRLEAPEMVQGGAIAGQLTPATHDEPRTEWKRPERKQWWKAHKLDVHIYTQGSPLASATVGLAPDLPTGHVTLTEDKIKEIHVMAYDLKQGATDALVSVVVVVGLVLIVWLVVMAVQDSNGNPGGGSDSGSGFFSDGGGSSD